MPRIKITPPLDTRLGTIEKATAEFSVEFEKLKALLIERNQAVAAAEAPFTDRINEQIAKTREKKTPVVGLVENFRDLFTKPRTRIFHNVKVGLRKLSGGNVVTDEDKTIALIRQNHPDKADMMIRTEESVVKETLNSLTVAELKAIGVHVTSTTDTVVFAPEETTPAEEAAFALLSVEDPKSLVQPS